MIRRSKTNIYRSKPNTITFRTFASSSAWQSYQLKLRRQSAKKQAVKRLPAYLLLLIVLLAALKGVFWIYDRPTPPSPSTGTGSNPLIRPLDQTTIQGFLARHSLSEITRPAFDIHIGVQHYRIKTSIIEPLQKQLINNIDKRYAQHVAIVAMEPETGKIVTMASHDRTGADSNVCTCPDFPAASLFKIVTAAAAIEQLEFKSHTPVTYNGKKYSLYKSQLKPKDNKYTNHISFAESFAGSINPVFGKLGINRLKKAGLEKYGLAFGFNRQLPFDLQLPPSPLTIEEEPYNWAEIACGFNRKTLISPLHAAIVASVAVNHGKLMHPTLVETVRQDNQLVYQSQGPEFSRAVAPDTAEKLKKLMHTTITRGTASKTFREARGDPVLSELYIGGKTGSINNNPEKIKYDWFAGFAEAPGNSRKLAVAVLVAHKEYIGTRAAAYAKMAFQQYFQLQTNDAGA